MTGTAEALAQLRSGRWNWVVAADQRFHRGGPARAERSLHPGTRQLRERDFHGHGDHRAAEPCRPGEASVRLGDGDQRAAAPRVQGGRQVTDFADENVTSPDDRAREIEGQLTDDERFALIIGVFGQPGRMSPTRDPRIPEGTTMSAGYTAGVPRLGVPALHMSDASMGVTNPGYVGREGDTATAMPACIALGAAFNPALATRSGAAIGREARSRGFNVQLAGGINLLRDPRNGRNFEYLSEDPWHSAVLAAASVEGIQGEGVISTLKHFCLNCNETNRHWLDATIDPAAHRESDLLAFQIAIERSSPGAIMSSYNKVNGVCTGGNRALLHEARRYAWEYPGWVMSDWGATPSCEFALAGHDQECGVQFDVTQWGGEAFTEPLRQAYAEGRSPKQR